MSSVDVMEILKEPKMTKICAPMVRYSKLAFRTLVRQYKCDLCFTPMIMADSFIQSAQARENEFTTNAADKPLIVQFAAKTPIDFGNATELVAPYCNGVDLNCGCPQRWAIKDGYGSYLLDKPQLIKDLVLTVRNRIPQPFTVSVKIRLLNDINKCVDLCRILEHAGVSFITVHARTPQMRKEPINIDGLKLIRDCTKIPLIANGDIKSLTDAQLLYNETNCEGIMVANGILTNPALFTGATETPQSCIQDWLNITAAIPTNFTTVHHHLVFMLEKILSRKEKQIFNSIQNNDAMHEFIKSNYNIQSQSNSILYHYDSLKPINCNYNTIWCGKKIRDQKICINDTDKICQQSLTNLFQLDDSIIKS